ncbi:hypothetical protein ES703_62099 [subsurface metagenome]
MNLMVRQIHNTHLLKSIFPFIHHQMILECFDTINLYQITMADELLPITFRRVFNGCFHHLEILGFIVGPDVKLVVVVGNVVLHFVLPGMHHDEIIQGAVSF